MNNVFIVVILVYSFCAFRMAKDVSDYNSNKGKYKKNKIWKQ